MTRIAAMYTPMSRLVGIVRNIMGRIYGSLDSAMELLVLRILIPRISTVSEYSDFLGGGIDTNWC